MKVLLLSPYEDTRLERAIRSKGDAVIRCNDKITPEMVHGFGADVIVSYGYRHMISKEVIASVPRAMNLHISLLPHNRGADPNLWSWIDRTPKGVSIHLITPELDAGNILAQAEFKWQRPEDETLETTYWNLRGAVEQLCLMQWDHIKVPYYPGEPQELGGSVHKSTDKDMVWKSLPHGWQTKISVVEEIGDEIRQAADFWSDPVPMIDAAGAAA